MKADRKRFAGIFLLASSLAVFMGCEEEAGVEAPPAPAATPTPAASTANAQDVKGEKEENRLPQLKETDFIGSAKRRDPFKFFSELLEKKEEVQKLVQREVKLKEYDVSELKLVGIITKIGDPRAMLVVPDGSGFVLKRGDYVGRADFVQRGKTGEAIQVNWRVARIHGSGKEEERGVYLVRDDPTTSKGVDITRFLPLHGD